MDDWLDSWDPLAAEYASVPWSSKPGKHSLEDHTLDYHAAKRIASPMLRSSELAIDVKVSRWVCHATSDVNATDLAASHPNSQQDLTWVTFQWPAWQFMGSKPAVGSKGRGGKGEQDLFQLGGFSFGPLCEGKSDSSRQLRVCR